VQVYFAFSEQSLRHDLGQLATVLAVGWLLVVLVAGLVGRSLARRTLEPVARAGAAARSMAEGLLATRLPVEARDEFGAWAESFNEMAEALEAKIAELSEAQARERRFASDVAHELRTPLTALVGEASLLGEHLDRMPDGARRPAELLIHDVRRLRRLVEELMEISRLDSGRAGLAVDSVDLTLLAAAVIRSRGWEGRVDLRGRRVVVATDRRRVERVVANLVGNALEHGGRTVRVRVGRQGAQALVEVADDGPGIGPEHLPHVFERFYKADPARASPGSGLGLAIAMENTRLLGGTVHVWSQRGIGSRFTLRLPVTEPLREGEDRVTGQSQDEVRPPQEGAEG
jgi:two-component system sensor histidine kinase MtrB